MTKTRNNKHYCEQVSYLVTHMHPKTTTWCEGFSCARHVVETNQVFGLGWDRWQVVCVHVSRRQMFQCNIIKILSLDPSPTPKPSCFVRFFSFVCVYPKILELKAQGMMKEIFNFYCLFKNFLKVIIELELKHKNALNCFYSVNHGQINKSFMCNKIVSTLF